MLSKRAQYYLQIEKLFFLAKEIILYYLFNHKKYRILFSKAPVQEENLRKGLRFCKIDMDFNEFNKVNIRNYDLIVPLTIDDLKILNEKRTLLKDAKIPIPTLESINICDDKYLFYQTLKKNGFEYLLPKIDSNLPYTYILKKKIAERGEDNYVIADAQTEEKYKDLIASPDFFCQEMVLGNKEYATHILYKNGKITASLNIEYIFFNETPIKGQDKVGARRITKCPHLSIFSNILASINFEGICCFNYKEIDQKPLIIEINPRFGASLSLYFITFLRKI